MRMAFSWMWLVLVVLSVALMTSLYIRVVYALWFKGDDNNQLSDQQRVSDEDGHYACLIYNPPIFFFLSIIYIDQNCSNLLSMFVMLYIMMRL